MEKNRITLEQRAAQIAAKLAEGVARPSPEALRNKGLRRTPEKKALLEMLARFTEDAQAMAREMRGEVGARQRRERSGRSGGQ